jgi:hypothetical protein
MLGEPNMLIENKHFKFFKSDEIVPLKPKIESILYKLCGESADIVVRKRVVWGIMCTRHTRNHGMRKAA